MERIVLLVLTLLRPSVMAENTTELSRPPFTLPTPRLLNTVTGTHRWVTMPPFVFVLRTTTLPSFTLPPQIFFRVVKPLDIFLPDSTNVSCAEYVRECSRTCMQDQIYAEQCAGGCICDVRCVRYGNCCPNFQTTCRDLYQDELDRLHNSMAKFDSVGDIDCVYLQAKRTGFSYHIVSQCPEYIPAKMKRQCSHPSDTVLNDIPVLDRKSGLHFKNHHCAQCYGVSDFVFWSAEMYCEHLSPEMPVNYPSASEFVKLISTLNRRELKAAYSSCELSLRELEEETLIKCPMVCPSDKRIPCKETNNVGGNKPYSFGILMNFRKDGKLEVSAAGNTQGTRSFQCSDEFLGSSEVQFCAANSCNQGYILQEGECLSPFVPALVIVSSVYNRDITGPPGPPMHPSIINVLGNTKEIKLSYQTTRELSVQTEYMVIQTLRNQTSQEWDTRLKEFKHLAQKSIQNIAGYKWLDVYAYRTFTGPVAGNTSSINNCSWMRYDQNEVIIMDQDNVWLLQENRSISAVRVVEQQNFVFVCTVNEDALNNASDNSRPAHYLSEASGVVSSVLIAMSVVCLLARLLLQCHVTSFSTFPGKIQVCLCSTLLLAHISFLIAPWLHTFPAACAVMGMVLHWTFLSSVAWCSVISVDIACTLRPSKMMKGGMQKTHTGKIVLYGMCAWLGPLVVVGCGITFEYSLNVSSKWRPGYGQEMCWIQSSLALLVLFVIPLGCLLIINVVTGTGVAVMLYLSSKESAAMRAGGVQSSSYPVSLYLRLMVLSGGSWLTGLLAGAVDSAPLWYVFIILNAGQGIYIFMAFVCRKRVFRELGCCKETQETSTAKATCLTQLSSNKTENGSSNINSV